MKLSQVLIVMIIFSTFVYADNSWILPKSVF